MFCVGALRAILSVPEWVCCIPELTLEFKRNAGADVERRLGVSL